MCQGGWRTNAGKPVLYPSKSAQQGSNSGQK